ncbi:uncharacterized protein BDR25DRAFT_307745 [Lindgomyces ingoldianus]|uniref:Uncharacterized protein n=1 Tax=Lindgomyces ingoldianus TaxID=673940 RepID=A0ACB6QAP6_9PLEO|nr:uncharacterized protein BDR25DRAFT_307745 [Lindgomyces ingoldianus]KAF2463452.1 hypothetical protein BDR25DRAFT_307745 [Lindgomyces ingoldianus]
MAFGGAALKLFQTFLYAIEFCCAGIILGIYSYFLSVLADRNLPISTWSKAVEGISGAAVLYTIFAVLLTCCLGGKIFFAFLGIVFDLLFCAAFVALAILTRNGAHSCSGNVNTPLGSGNSHDKQGFRSNNQGDQVTYAASLGTACRLNSACFAVSILGAILFLISALVQLALGRKHKKEKRFGPSPANNYTRGTGVRFWQRRRKNRGGLRDPEMVGAVPATGTLAPGVHDTRPSHDTAYTGSTMAPHSAGYENPNKPLHGGYHTAPTGTYNATPATNY